jgi:SAM-dependent methyltransferase
MPFPGKSFDVLILFEAIYYLRSVNEFLRECRRILRPGGKVLIATANKDLYDFNPSPYSITYYGVVDLTALFANEGFGTEFFGDTNVYNVSYRQRLLRPIKKVAVALNLIPKTMKGKRWLKRLIFGELQPMPAELMTDHGSYLPPEPIRGDRPDTEHKTILCAATLM